MIDLSGDVIYYLDIKYDTIVDGIGFRNSIYCAGCDIHCKGCHNPQSHDINNGKAITVDKASELLLENGNNITFTGGECSLQSKAFCNLAKILKQHGRTIWLYSGRTFEELTRSPLTKELLSNVDVLVDGRFIEELRDTSLRFRGSLNQRIIDAHKSLEQEKIILWGDANE